MKSHALKLGIAAAATVALAACNNSGNANKSETAQSPAAQKAAGNKTIASGLNASGKFMAAAKAAGLDQTLAGPGPYTVFVPDDAAMDAAPAGTFDAKPENRGQLTGIITNLILPGTVMAADIGKAIDAGKGKAVLATMGGGTLTATKDGDKIVLADSAGHKATVTQADDQFSNGVVHHVDAVLMPAKGAAAKPAVGDKAG
jgi:uncharacterized surface protein with fasciclin (FAS1) repeats